MKKFAEKSLQCHFSFSVHCENTRIHSDKTDASAASTLISFAATLFAVASCLSFLSFYLFILLGLPGSIATKRKLIGYGIKYSFILKHNSL